MEPRGFEEAQHEFAEKGPVEQKAREAEEALEGPEAEELEKARKETGEGKTHWPSSTVGLPPLLLRRVGARGLKSPTLSDSGT